MRRLTASLAWAGSSERIVVSSARRSGPAGARGTGFYAIDGGRRRRAGQQRRQRDAGDPTEGRGRLPAMAEGGSGIPGTSSEADFVHLHVHSQYSMLDGAIRIETWSRRVKALGMRAVALTDHGNMFGAMQLYKACKERGVKPILGCEVYVVPAIARRAAPRAATAHHLVLLAREPGGLQEPDPLVSSRWATGRLRGQARAIDLEHARSSTARASSA